MCSKQLAYTRNSCSTEWRCTSITHQRRCHVAPRCSGHHSWRTRDGWLADCQPKRVDWSKRAVCTNDCVKVLQSRSHLDEAKRRPNVCTSALQDWSPDEIAYVQCSQRMAMNWWLMRMLLLWRMLFYSVRKSIRILDSLKTSLMRHSTRRWIWKSSNFHKSLLTSVVDCGFGWIKCIGRRPATVWLTWEQTITI